MTQKEMASILAMFTTAIPNMQKLDLETTATVWAQIMPDITYTAAKEAVISIIREQKIPVLPPPAVLLEKAKAIMRRGKVNNPPNVYDAWDEVCQKLGCVKQNGIEWSHPAVKETVRIIGAYTIATATYDISPRFSRTYEDVLKRKHDTMEFAIAKQICSGSGDLNALFNDRKSMKQIADERMLEGKSERIFYEN